MTDFLWEQEESQQQKTDTINYKNTKDAFFDPVNEQKRIQERRKKVYFITTFTFNTI